MMQTDRAYLKELRRTVIGYSIQKYKWILQRKHVKIMSTWNVEKRKKERKKNLHN